MLAGPIRSYLAFFFFFNDTATTEIYTLSLHDALPILGKAFLCVNQIFLKRSLRLIGGWYPDLAAIHQDRKSTRLNSSHSQISYAVFCLKKKIRNIALFHNLSLDVDFRLTTVCPKSRSD